jgi:hypothetical protein
MEAKEIIKSGFENVVRTVDRVLEGLTQEELAWHPRPDANSIGLIIFHSFRSEDNAIKRLQGKPQIWESGKWYLKFNKAVNDGGAHYTAAQVDTFVVPDLKELLAYAGAVRKETLSYIQGLKPEDFERKVVLPPPPAQMVMPAGMTARPWPPFDPVVGLMLMREITHLSQHAGEISYLRGLKRGMDK